jgi:hypothetical protein
VADGCGSMEEPPGMRADSFSPLPRARGLQICCQFFFFPPKKDRIHLSLQGEGAWEQENEPRICWGVRIDTMQENW